MRVGKLTLVGFLMVGTADSLLSQTQSNKTLSQRAAEVAQQVSDQQEYFLQYRLRAGEQIRWHIEHIASTQVQIAGKYETTSSRTQSTKLWKVSSVDNAGNITFVHSVESTSLWQQVGEAEPISYDSQTSTDVPEQFLAASEMIGKPLAVVTISPSGSIVDRKTGVENASFGIGEICTPFPDKPIQVGHQWNVPTEFQAVDEDGRRLKLKARHNYQLTRVADGIAIISFRTQVLTPIESEQVHAQLLQKLNEGYVAFDIPQGRLVTKEVEWNEKVQAYAGPESHLQYIGRLTEKLVRSEGKSTSESRTSESNTSPAIIRPGDAPIIRK